MLVENCGIEYYPPSEAATKTAKSTTSKISDPEDLKTTTTRNKQKGRKMKQHERKRAIYLEEKEDGEISEPEEIGYINKENTGEHRKSQANSEPILAVDIFQKLVSELDDHLTATVNKFYEPVLKELDKLIEAPTSASDILPTLFIRGHCIDWDGLHKMVESKHPQLVIRRTEGQTVNELFNNLGPDDKVLLFVAAHLYADYTPIFTRIEDRGSTYLVFYTSTTFSFIYERISRQMTCRMQINKIIFPPSDKFVNFLLDEYIPLGFMPRSCIQIHGETLAAVRRYFQFESRSLKSLRQIFVLALYDFATSGKKIEEEEIRDQVAERVCKYRAMLEGFAGFSGEDKFKLHCNIYGRETDYFLKFYGGTITDKCQNMTRIQWRDKLTKLAPALRNPFLPNKHLKKCEELLTRIEKDDGGENNPPKAKDISTGANDSFSTGSSSGIRRPIQIAARKTQSKSTFFTEQERKRSKMINPLSEQLRKEIFDFLDDIFTRYIRQLPEDSIAGPGDKNMLSFSLPEDKVKLSTAGPGDTSLLGTSLSSEIDSKLGSMAKEALDIPDNMQLDLCLIYYLLVTQSSDFTAITLDSLANNFDELAKPIEMIELKARFMAAISQLEHIGALKMVSEGIVRLTYLPGATLTKDLFEKA